jgi:hypothetical protein
MPWLRDHPLIALHFLILSRRRWDTLLRHRPLNLVPICSRKCQTPFRFRNRATEIFRGFDPFLNYGFHVRQCFLIGGPICRTTR